MLRISGPRRVGYFSIHMMDDSILREDPTTVNDSTSQGCGIDSQPSHRSEDFQPLVIAVEEEKESVSENVVILSETETSSHFSKTSEAGAETDVIVHDLNSTIPENRNTNDKTTGKHLQYNYTAELILKSLYQSTDVSVSSTTIQQLTDGFIARFLPSLVKAQSSINQIKSSQSVLIETVQQETSKFTDFQAIIDLKETMVKAKQYHNKLLRLKREMTDLHEKSKKLKKRALKLQQHKQKEELTRAHNLEKEFEKERMLTARVAPPQD